MEVTQKMTEKPNSYDKRKDAIYVRQSLDKKDSLSIESQIDKGLSFSDDNAEIYRDKGYSGKNTDRPALQRLKNDIEANQIKRVFVYRLDRISRNISDFYNLYQLMESHNVKFISITENFDTSSPIGRAMMGVLIVFAQMERESIQERVKDNYYYRINDDGRWPGGPAPLGFDNARTDQNKPTLKANSDIEFVKEAFNLYANTPNISLAKVGRILYSKGFRSKRANGQFDNVTISRILQNPIYAIADSLLYKYYQTRKAQISNDISAWDGTTSAHIVGKKPGNSNVRSYTSMENQTVYKTNFSGVVTSKEFITVQERLNANKQFGRSNAPSKMKEFAGKIKCAECGYAIKIYNYPHLNCYGRSALHCCDLSIQMKFPELQAEIVKRIQNELDKVALKIISNLAQKDKENKKIEELNRQIENLIDLAARGEEDIPQISKSIAKLKKQVDEIELNQQRGISFASQAKISGALPLKYSRLNDEEKKSVVQLLIDKITIDKNENIKIYWNL